MMEYGYRFGHIGESGTEIMGRDFQNVTQFIANGSSFLSKNN